MPEQVICNNTVITRTVELVSADMDGETVMMSIENGKYYGLDTVGSVIWELLAIPRTVSDMVQILEDGFTVQRDQCQADVIEFIHHLYSEGLVKIA